MDMSWASAWAVLFALAVVAPLPSVAAGANATDVSMVVAAVLDLPAPQTSSAMPIEPIQTTTCGCTPAPNRKQKIIVKINGQDLCQATSMPCTAP
ncbi:MAG: hypothetical protein AB7I59_18705 [Geminicoccaceae bacterium]